MEVEKTDNRHYNIKFTNGSGEELILTGDDSAQASDTIFTTLANSLPNSAFAGLISKAYQDARNGAPQTEVRAGYMAEHPGLHL